MSIQGGAWESNIRLLSGATPVTGKIFSDIVVRVKKFGESVFTTRPLLAGEFIELDNGFYVIKWLSSDINILGPFLAEVTGTGFDPIIDKFDVDFAPVGFTVSPEICVVTGNVVDLGGDPNLQESIVYRPTKLPATSGPSLISGGLTKTVPDAFGNFSVALIRNATVLVEMERSGIRNTIVVPDQPTALLLDLLPPIS